jgi:hypothetical protein
MNDFQKIELAFDLLENSEVMQEFDDCLWIKVDRKQYDDFFECPTDESRAFGPHGGAPWGN